MARPSQGEALTTWALWAAIALCVVVTYSRLDPALTYHVSRNGFAGGLSRAVTVVNFPIGLVAIALVLVAASALTGRAWWIGGPAIALCATIPLFNEQGNLDAHWGNAIPAFGVALALGLTVAATLRAGAAFGPRRRFDVARLVAGAVLLLVSLPWLAAELGFHFPGDLFMGEELAREPDGTSIAAVHLGHHHGQDGAMLVVTALLLSRMEFRRGALRSVTLAYLGGLLAYGAVNCVQDAWNEQLVKRGWLDAGIPSALLPSLSWIWLVVLGLGVLAAAALLREGSTASYSAP
ncbi:MAG TPA: hypothetical protein VFV56_05840 [Gaiellaceae bacterium]|nr:hypothetical protein [Gaiellaceae bacterium]